MEQNGLPPTLERPEDELARIKRKKRRRLRARNICTTVAVLLVVLLAVAMAGVRLFGFTPYTILSGSMTPKYQVGDLVYTRETAPENIQVGDVITYVYNEERNVVTHRVVEADRENRCFYTKGDANKSTDGKEVLYENVVGVVAFSIPKLGYLSVYLMSPSGRYVGIAAGLTLILVLFVLPELFSSKRKKQKEE